MVTDVSVLVLPLGTSCDDSEATEASGAKVGCSHLSQGTVEVIAGSVTVVVRIKSVVVITSVEIDSLGLAVDDVFQ